MLGAALILVGLAGVPQDLGDLRKELQAHLKAGNPQEAGEAVRRIALLDSKKAVEFLVTSALRFDHLAALGDAGKLHVFRIARESLSRITDTRARKFLFDETEGLRRARDREKKVFLTEIIGLMDGDDSEKALIAILSSSRTDAVRMLAMEALARRRSVKSVEAILDVLEQTEKHRGLCWKTALESLVQITGYRFHTAVDWKNFWVIRGPSFDPEKDRGKEKGGEMETREREVPRIMDQPIYSKRFVFLIDVSRSMHIKDPTIGGEQPKRKGGGAAGICEVCGKVHGGVGLPDSRMRIERVKRELLGMIKLLDPDVKFNILAFTTDVRPWRNDGRLHLANAQNKREAAKFVEGLTYVGYTSIDYALEDGFDHPEADAIYLLSDGTPFRDKMPLPTEPILEAVEARNFMRKLKIFTIGFSASADVGFLTALAKQNGGSFKAVR